MLFSAQLSARLSEMASYDWLMGGKYISLAGAHDRLAEFFQWLGGGQPFQSAWMVPAKSGR